MDVEKNCENCRHYYKHYFWYKDRLKETYSGHCQAYRVIKYVACNASCKKWEIAEAKQERQCEEFKRILKQAAKQINDIAMLLNAEK